MPTTLTWEDLRALASFRAENGRAISLYVDLEPSVAATPVDLHGRTRALLDETAKLVQEARHDLTHDQLAALRSDVDRVREYVDTELDRDGARGLALFTASLDNLWRPVLLAGTVADAVRVNGDLYLTPLVPLVESGEGSVVAHAGRERGEIFTLHDGRLVQVDDLTEKQPRRHDQGGWSQANYQRHVDNLVHAHLRDVADALDGELRTRGSAAIVVASTDDVRAELEPLLSGPVRTALAGWMHTNAHASTSELEVGVAAVLRDRRVQREDDALERWREDMGRGARATAGWQETLEAASDGRVEMLLYSEGINNDAWRCPQCSRIQVEDGMCPLDGSELELHPEGLDLVIHETLAHGGLAMAMTGRRDLDPVGGVGALLRY